MSIRKRALPSGWYPENRKQTEYTIDAWRERNQTQPRRAVSGVAPHAGWDFSGELAYLVVSNLVEEADTVVVLGGHLPPVGQVLCAVEDEFETPLGALRAATEIRELLTAKIDIKADTYADNTVEIQLPLVKYLFPRAEVLHIRVSPTKDAIELGRHLFSIAEKVGKSMVLVGSTDLTHYGPAYGFTPAGRGPDAVAWVRDENDRGFIDALLGMDFELALRHSQERSSACSAGAAAAA